MNKGPKILYIDIETSLMEAYVFQLQYNDYIPVKQIKKDWQVLSWAAKWQGKDKVYYMGKRPGENSDKRILLGAREMMDQADIVVYQNGKKFDKPKLYARFIINKIRPPSSFQEYDTCNVAKKVFGFTSNSLAYLCEALDLPYKKDEHPEFPGIELWIECAKGNPKAWRVMKRYNKGDITTLEALHRKFEPWDTVINYNVYSASNEPKCPCGSKDFRKNGYTYGSAGKYQRYACKICGAELKVTKNGKFRRIAR
jgi:hypothetical protein